MAKFNIEWKATVWYTTQVEAETEEEAVKLFENGDGGEDIYSSADEEILNIVQEV
mgnify:CR=1 FL=1